MILDDSVVVGTTLERLHRKLSEYVGSGQVTAMTVCVDAEQHAPYLTEKLIIGGPDIRVLGARSTVLRGHR